MWLDISDTVPVTFPVTFPVKFPVTSPVTLPVKFPVTLPVKFPVISPVTSPVKFPVTSPVTSPVKFPDIFVNEAFVPEALPLIKLNVTSSPVPTVWPIDICPSVIVIPEPLEKCALVSAALGPVYVITPDALSYVKEPSPPASVIDIADIERAFVKYRFVEPSDKASVSWLDISDTIPVTFPVTFPDIVVNDPLVNEALPEPDIFVKPVILEAFPPSEISTSPSVNELLTSLEFSMDPSSWEFVIEPFKALAL